MHQLGPACAPRPVPRLRAARTPRPGAPAPVPSSAPTPVSPCRLRAPRAPRRVVGLAARCVAIQPPACSFSGHNTPRCIAIQNPYYQPPLFQYNWAVAQSNFSAPFFFVFHYNLFIFYFSNLLLEKPKNIYNHHFFFNFPEHSNKFIKFYFLSFSSVLHLVKP